MPRRLRVQFQNPLRFLVMTAERGTYSSSGQTATLTYTPNIPAGTPGEWVQIQGSFSTPGAFNWYTLSIDDTRDLFWSTTWNGYLVKFNMATGAMTSVQPWVGTTSFHNRTQTYDQTNDRYWVGGGTEDQIGAQGQYWVNPNTGVATSATMTNQPTYEAFTMWDSRGPGNYFNDPTNNPAAPRLITFGGWNQMNFRTLALSPIGSDWVGQSVSGSYPPLDLSGGGGTNGWRNFTTNYTVWDYTRDEIVSVDPLNQCIYCVPRRLTGAMAVMVGGWRTRATTGGALLPRHTNFVYDGDRDLIVGYCSNDKLTEASANVTKRETWLLNMRTLVWTKAASQEAGDTTPGLTSYVQRGSVFDYTRNRTLHVHNTGGDDLTSQVWAYTAPAREAGTLVGRALPAHSGTTWGQNYYGAHFVTSYGTKHVLGTYNTVNGDIYMTGGDGLTSSTDGMWRYNPTTGAATVVDIPRVQGGRKQPGGLNDPSTWAWDEIRNVYVMIPAGANGYVGNNVEEDCTGYWEYNPTTDVWTQDLRIWSWVFVNGPGNPGDSIIGAGTGRLWGALYDPVNRRAFAIQDSGEDENPVGIPRVFRWDLQGGTQLSTVAFDSANAAKLTNNGNRGTQIRYSRPCRVGRKGYWLGQSLFDSTVHLFDMCFFSVDLDTNAVTVLTPPLRNRKQSNHDDGMFGLCKAGSNHLVWIEVTPNGGIYGIHVYDISKDRWWQERLPVAGASTPGFHPTDGGRFAANSFGEASATSVWFCGSIENFSGMRLWIYTPPGAVA
jgi:hypothetical protein